MKKLSTLFIALVLVLTSCSKDDTIRDASGDILGVWHGKSVNYSGTSTTNFEGESFKIDYVGEGYDVDFTLTFTDNPNIVASEGSYGVKLTISALGQSQIENVPDNSFASSANWTKNGNELTILESESTESVTYQIIELTGNSLIIVADEIQDITQTIGESFTNIEMRIELTR